MEGRLRIKNGITMDSGSAAFVMPTRWLPMFELQQSKGSLAGQRYVGATGNVVPNEGEKHVEFVTGDGQDRALTFQCADLNKMLAGIAGVADANNGILFLKDGGHILELDEATLERVKELVRRCSKVTNFIRKGNVYIMDAYVRIPPGSTLASTADKLKNPQGLGRQEQ